ncbi:CAMK family protein kinase [Tritrichomonas foetus]|uniref:CAMK family protein kinase n=1 Tax=Tritrichomonas foetus TaxID=1144522 RepID=A0A1J4K080_9EUKA|nr:CAMK family protein kinase [Tritrichomonas foetus]|eukprot:OHT04635.1 CAMK family protein kinase [Tritrichomonas foetus]
MNYVLCTDDGIEIEFPSEFGNYRYVNPIGQGSSSVVILVENRITRECSAAKLMRRTPTIDKNLEREIRFLQSISHPNIIAVRDIVYLPKIIIVVMEYCSRGDMITEIGLCGGFSKIILRKYSHQIISAISFLHSRNWTHRDLKPDNILIDSSGQIKLADFGHCGEVKKNNIMMQTLCGTYYYTPPEVIEERPYDGKKADVWGIGVVLYCLATGQLPWEMGSEVAVRERILNGEVMEPDPPIDPDIFRIIKKCIVVDPEKRATAAELIEDPLFAPERRKNELLHMRVRNTGNATPEPGRGLSRPILASASKVNIKKKLEINKHSNSLYNFTFKSSLVL